MSRAQFEADVLIAELYNKAWLGSFSLKGVEKSEQVHSAEIQPTAL
jgi:hypothetical protein